MEASDKYEVSKDLLTACKPNYEIHCWHGLKDKFLGNVQTLEKQEPIYLCWPPIHQPALKTHNDKS